MIKMAINRPDRMTAKARFVTLLVLLVACCRFISAEVAAEVVIARAGQARVTIVTPDGATAAEQKAAAELAVYLEKISGARFEIITEAVADGGAANIYVGQTQFARSQGCDFTAMAAEKWQIRTIEDNLILTGGRPRGSLYAVYEFLENNCGVRWYDLFTEKVPVTADLRIKRLDRTGAPAFLYRNIWTSIMPIAGGPGSLYHTVGKELDRRFHAANKLNGNSAKLPAEWGDCAGVGTPGIAHTTFKYLPPAEYFADHPEYYALKGGQRTKYEQICFTNTAVREIFRRKLKENIHTDMKEAVASGRQPPLLYYIGQEDRHHPPFCECADCLDIHRREGGPSGLILDLVNFLADGIKDDFPDVRLVAMAYTVAAQPPLTLRAKENVIVQFADYRSECMRAYTHPHNRSNLMILEQWSKSADNLSAWDYWITYENQFELPYSNATVLAADIATFHAHNVLHFHADCQKAHTNAYHALKRWLGAKMLDNPNRPAEPLIRQFMADYYGPAAEFMYANLQFMENTIAETDARIEQVSPDGNEKISPFMRPFLSADYILTCSSYLDQAEAACLQSDNPAFLRHVRRERIPVDNTLLVLWARFQMAYAEEGKQFPYRKAEVIDRYQAARLAQIEWFASHGLKQAWKFAEREDLNIEIAGYRAEPPPLPKQFQELPPEKIIDLFWPHFPPNNKVSIQIDDAAAGGRAFTRVYEESLDQDREFVIGLYSFLTKQQGPSLSLRKDEIPQDGKFHFYRIGSFAIDTGTILHTHWSWHPFIKLDRVVDPRQTNRFEAHVSLKILGRDFILGSDTENVVAIDRVVLIRE